MFFVFFSIFASGSFTSRVRAGVIPRCSASGIACSEAKILFYSWFGLVSGFECRRVIFVVAGNCQWHNDTCSTDFCDDFFL